MSYQDVRLSYDVLQRTCREFCEKFATSNNLATPELREVRAFSAALAAEFKHLYGILDTEQRPVQQVDPQLALQAEYQKILNGIGSLCLEEDPGCLNLLQAEEIRAAVLSQSTGLQVRILKDHENSVPGDLEEQYYFIRINFPYFHSAT